MAKQKTHIVSVKANKIRISTTITGVDTELETIGDAVKLKIDVGGIIFTAPTNPKSFRKVQAALKAGEPGTVIVVLTGELDLDTKTIGACGIVAQVKIQKSKDITEDGSIDQSTENNPDAGGQAFIAPEPIVPPSPTIIIKKQRIPEPQVESDNTL